MPFSSRGEMMAFNKSNSDLESNACDFITNTRDTHPNTTMLFTRIPQDHSSNTPLTIFGWFNVFNIWGVKASLSLIIFPPHHQRIQNSFNVRHVIQQKRILKLMKWGCQSRVKWPQISGFRECAWITANERPSLTHDFQSFVWTRKNQLDGFNEMHEKSNKKHAFYWGELPICLLDLMARNNTLASGNQRHFPNNTHDHKSEAIGVSPIENKQFLTNSKLTSLNKHAFN